MTARILALCAGYGGLEMAIRAGMPDSEVVAYAENDPFAARVFAAHNPGLTNLGDITRADWRVVRELYRPDVVAAGFPCRNISNAGNREGIGGQWSRVWKNVAEAVRVTRPRYVFLENVAAIRSRGLDVVAADLAAIGYDARWTCVRAGDPEVGAPHPRDRWFCIAHPADAYPDHLGRDWRPWDLTETEGRDESAHRSDAAPAAGLSLLPTPRASDGGLNRGSSAGWGLRNTTKTLDAQWIAKDGTDYGPAIRRWEAVTGRPAPCPTEPGARGNRRLSPLFSEWLMGLPAGHVTGHGLTRQQQLQIIGNGVVPQQAHHGFGLLLGARAAHLGVEAVAA